MRIPDNTKQEALFVVACANHKIADPRWDSVFGWSGSLDPADTVKHAHGAPLKGANLRGFALIVWHF